MGRFERTRIWYRPFKSASGLKANSPSSVAMPVHLIRMVVYSGPSWDSIRNVHTRRQS